MILTQSKSNFGQKTRKFWFHYGAGYLFVLPALLMFSVFVIFPFFKSLYLSFTDWNGATEVIEFIGFQNYAEVFQDDIFWTSLRHNVTWMIVVSFVPIVLGFGMALLLWTRPFGFLAFRTIYFLPQVIGEGALAIIWKIIYQPRTGVLYHIGEAVNLKFLLSSPLATPDAALWAVMLTAIWAHTGFFFVVLLAGLQNVDRDLMDAARVDGANGMQRLYYVIIPQLSHVLTMVTVLALISGLKIFGIIWGMTRGGPARGTEVIGTYAYNNFSNLGRVGYSSALTMVMAGLALIITVVFIRLRERGEV